MLYLLLGLIIGLLIAVLLLVVEIRFGSNLVGKNIQELSKQLALGPRGQVLILNERLDTKEERMKRNDAAGKDTPLKDLYDLS